MEPRVLEGSALRLLPLRLEYAARLWETVGEDYEAWDWITSPQLPVARSPQDLEFQFGEKLKIQAEKGWQYYLFEEKSTGKLIGSSGFQDVRPIDHHVEIGSSIIARQYRGGKVNYEAKYLMLKDAFERRDCVKVSFKVNIKNLPSLSAIKKIGATYEGTFRHQRLERDGSWRDAAYFSIIVEEWPSVKAALESKISETH